jgi:hypothetical protein
LLFAALLLKPTSALAFPALFVLDLVTRPREDGGRSVWRVARDHAPAWLAATAAAAVTAAAAWRAGVLGDWYEVAVRFNAQVYARETPGPSAVALATWTVFVRYWHWYTALAALGAVLWARSGERRLLGLLAAGLAVSLASAAAQRKGFGYHFGGCLAVLGALASEALAHAWRWLTTASIPDWEDSRFQNGFIDPEFLNPESHESEMEDRPGRTAPAWRLRAAGAAVVGLAALGTAAKLDHEFRDQVRWHLGRIDDAAYYGRFGLGGLLQTADFLRRNTGPGETVWVYSYDPLIANLAGRALPFRFTNPYLFTKAQAPFDGADRWLAEAREGLRDRPPRYIVLRRSDGRTAVPGRVDYTFLRADDDSPPARLVRGELEQRYRLARSFRAFDVFELRPGPCAAGRAACPPDGPEP